MICEGCIKQSTCKYKEVVEEYEADAPELLFDEPLEATVRCKYKQTGHSYPYVTVSTPSASPIFPDSSTGTTTNIPDQFTYTS